MAERKVGVDPECVALARHFLADTIADEAISVAAVAHNLDELSKHIQRSVEDWFEAQNWEPH